MLIALSIGLASGSGAARRPGHRHVSSGYPVTNYVSYIGGKARAANPKLSPVYLGVVNGAQGGPQDIDDNTSVAAKTAIKYINQHLDGIHGHPLKEVFCAVPETVAAAAQCGQKMANDHRVHAVVVLTAVAVGDEAFESALAPTKKLLVLYAGNATDAHYKNSVWLFGSSTSLEGPFATFLKRLHAKTVAIVGPSEPTTMQSFNAVIAGLKLEHIKYKEVLYDPSTSDLTAPLEAAGAATADAIFTGVTYAGCADLYLALKELNIHKPVVADSPLCLTPATKAAEGGHFPPWYSGMASPLDSDKTDPSGAAMNRVTAMYGLSSLDADDFSMSTIAEVLTTAKFLNEVPPSETPRALQKVAYGFHGPMVWGPPKTICGEVRHAPQICLDAIQFFQPNAAGVFHDVGHGWISPPKGLPITVGGAP